MRILSITELLRLMQSEPCGLLAEAEHILRNTASLEPELRQARANITAIRAALCAAVPAPRPEAAENLARFPEKRAQNGEFGGPGDCFSQPDQMLFHLHKEWQFMHNSRQQ